VANTYLGLLADRQNLLLAEETLKAQQTTYQLLGKTRDAGMGSDLEVSQALSQVEAARADIARYLGRIAQSENALNLLAGTTIPPELLSAPDLIESVREIKAGLPSDVLLRRPDILMAEHQLRAAHANIDAARANFFPRIALTAGAGFMSADLGNLLKGAAGTWSFAPEALLPIFDRGRRRANLRVAEVDRDMAVAAYEASIQSAFREVSDSLALRTRLGQEQQAQQDLVNALDRAHRLADARYKAGMDSYLNVLVSQRSLYAAQQVLINVRTARLSNLITLYKVLGGGA
jgi:multidrug efflux system outer membrane protein